MNKESRDAINDGRANTVSVINLVLLIVILVLGLTWKFAGPSVVGSANGWLTKGDVAEIVKEAMDDAQPAAAAPTPAPTPTPTPAPAPAATTINTDELQEVYETVFFEGNQDAKVTVIEFSDVECPFCQRHTNNGTLDQVREKYGDDVSTVFMHFPLSFHPNAQKAGEAIECAGKLAGGEGFTSYKKALFAKGGKPTLDVIEATATEEGLDAASFMECVNGGEFAQKVTDQMAFGRSLGVTGTPGNIVMNNETGEYVKVSGAVPASAFDAAISSFLQ